MVRTAKRLMIAPSIGLFAGCLPLDSFCFEGVCHGWPGWGVLGFGLFGILSAPAGIAWFANPLLVITWLFLFFELTTPALLSAAAALALSASFLWFDHVGVSEGGNVSRITGYGLGYWLWLASAGCAFGAALIVRLLPRRTKSIDIGL